MKPKRRRKIPLNHDLNTILLDQSFEWSFVPGFPAQIVIDDVLAKDKSLHMSRD
jgi:hypothetical protein